MGVEDIAVGEVSLRFSLAEVRSRRIQGEHFSDRLGISREAVVIPLRPVHRGGVRLLPNGKLEIRVEADVAFEDWLPELERAITRLVADPAR